MPSENNDPADQDSPDKSLGSLFANTPTPRDEQIQSLQESLAKERDARKEERFVFIVLIVLLLDVVFFSIMPTFGGPIALLILELLILIPLARRMGMEEIAAIVSRVLDNVASKPRGGDEV